MREIRHCYNKMTQECTTVAKRPRIEDGTVEDKISELPDEVILHIFSLLSAEEIIRTSILSKRWESIWKKMRTLKFNNKNHKRSFSENVVRALLTHNGPILRNLEIAVKHGCDPVDLGVWTAIAYSRNVSKLVLILNDAPSFVIFPPTMLMRENTLDILKLIGKIMFNIPFPGVSLKTLKELHLYHVKFEDEDTLSNLCDGCSGLQKLVVELYITSGVGIFEINIPSLQSLTLGSFYCDEERFVISTPRLKHLNIRKFHGVKSCVIGETTELTEAKIAQFKINMDENILASITSVSHLTMHSSIKVTCLTHLMCIQIFISYISMLTHNVTKLYFTPPFIFIRNKYPRGQIFHGLLTLVLDTDGDRWCRLLSRMLEGSPNLQTLKLIGGFYCRDVSTWNEPARVPECLLHTLKTLMWTNYAWYEEDDYNVAQYILKSAFNLKNATFVTFEKYDHAICRRISDIANVTKASSQCQLLFDYRSDSSWSDGSDDDSDLDNFEAE